MFLLESYSIGKPADCVAEGTNRKLNENIPIPAVELVVKNGCVFIPHLYFEPHEIAFAAVDAAAVQLGFVKDVTGIEVPQRYMPASTALRKRHTASVIEIKSDAKRSV